MTQFEDNDVAIVTGAARGIGLAIANELATKGATVVLSDLDAPELTDAEQHLKGKGFRVKSIPADITDPEQVRNLVATTREMFGVPRMLVNNAGWTEIRRFIDTDEEFRRKIIEINFLGPTRVTHAVAGAMIDAKVTEGRIVFVTSDAGRVGSGGEAVYAGAKGGLISLTKSLAREFARYGITVNAVAPGPVDTRLYWQMEERRKDAIMRSIPMRRVGQPSEVAGAVAYFVARESSYTTGQIVSVSGGLTMAG